KRPPRTNVLKILRLSDAVWIVVDDETFLLERIKQLLRASNKVVKIDRTRSPPLYRDFRLTKRCDGEYPRFETRCLHQPLPFGAHAVDLRPVDATRTIYARCGLGNVEDDDHSPPARSHRPASSQAFARPSIVASCRKIFRTMPRPGIETVTAIARPAFPRWSAQAATSSSGRRGFVLTGIGSLIRTPCER